MFLCMLLCFNGEHFANRNVIITYVCGCFELDFIFFNLEGIIVEVFLVKTKELITGKHDFRKGLTLWVTTYNPKNSFVILNFKIVTK